MKRQILALMVLGLLYGCQSLVQPVMEKDGEPVSVIEAVDSQPVSHWLAQMQRIMTMDQEQLQEALKPLLENRPHRGEALFRYALLNQQLKDRLGWIRARDSLRQLKTEIPPASELIPLLNLLLLHNQSMINADARDRRMLEALEQNRALRQEAAAALVKSRRQSEQLQQKIDALTNLERSMSIRRSLTTDAAKDAENE